jgi:hypothetical protein
MWSRAIFTSLLGKDHLTFVSNISSKAETFLEAGNPLGGFKEGV